MNQEDQDVLDEKPEDEVPVEVDEAPEQLAPAPAEAPQPAEAPDVVEAQAVLLDDDGNEVAAGDDDPAEDPAAEKTPSAQDIAANAAGVARGAAIGAADTLRDGFFAMRDVRSASKLSSDARARARETRLGLESDEAALNRRDEVAANYPQIVEQETQNLAKATASMHEAQAKIDRLTTEKGELKARLDTMKKEHEQEIRPYKRLADGAKERLDNANRTMAEARRAVKSAEARVKDASDKREQSVASANRSLDSAQNRLRKAQAELTKLQNGNGSPDAIASMQSEVVAELAHVENAKAEVTRAGSSSQAGMDNAQTHLWTQQQSMESAQRECDEAKAEHDEKKAEYDRMREEAQAAEKALADAMDQHDRDILNAKADYDEAAEAHDNAQALLDEANDVYANPQDTEALRASVAKQHEDLDAAQAKVAQLEGAEKDLRHKTRVQRYALLAVAAVVLVVIVLVLLQACGQ